ncbi:hypothetical protein CVT24_002322 [Panaeolus cyanescens]|uniref:CRAL-TRIO domain-containing protein n=1 Tax=Panaeolus cyanescens TaxID=181874 RepID=A0A409YIM7_9AGAR|nr:hypothetical protein CVT24_002322 [Panaeolus cyanescens]
MTLPDLTEHQQSTLEAFRKELYAEGILHDGDSIGTDDATLLRFLRARKFDLTASKKMFKDCQEWRRTVEGVGIDELYRMIDPFDFPEREAVWECWPMYFHKTDKLPREIMPAASRAAGKPIGTGFVIVDLKGFGLSTFWQMKSLARMSFQISQDYYPETMGQLAIINAPSTFTMIWNAVKPWLAKETVSKVDILGSDYQKALLELVDAENLPSFLGGTCKCEEWGGCQKSFAGPWKEGRSITSSQQPTPTNTPNDAPSTLATPSSAPAASESTTPSAITSQATSSSSASAPAQTTMSNTSGKYVVAHHMVGNTYPYTLNDWAEDVTLATAAGIDGFALNTGRDVWEPERIADAYEAAKQSGTGFKLFLSLDMTSLPCGSAQDAQNLRDLVKRYIDHPNQLQYDNKALVSTFAGDTCTFGQGSTVDAWKSQFTQHDDLNGKIYFVPSFFIDPAKFGEFSGVMHGDFNWNSGWPIQVTTNFAQQAAAQASADEKSSTVLRVVTGATSAAAHLEKGLQDALADTLSEQAMAVSKFIGSTDTDNQHISGLSALADNAERSGKQLYMGAVSPWFFTHYGPDSYNKNFVYLSDQHLYSKRWESIIDSRDSFDIIQVLSWNDYGESHYIGPIKGDQPKSQAWTDGMDHTGWLELTGYYATAFKTGQFPTVEKDKLFMWSRPHPAKASSPDPVPQPTNYELFEDTVWAVVMATAPSTVTLTTSSTTSKSFEVPAGVSKLAIPISAGGMMKGTIERDGQVVLELNPSQFQFQGSPSTYNYNAFVAHASA